MIKSLVNSVQRNCDIADAQHGTDFTMCVYLMKMREYFRWEQGLGFHDPLPKEVLGDWLSSKETSWLELDEADFGSVEIDSFAFDPFDAEAINAVLRPHNLVYSAGLEGCAKPHFYLAELEREERSIEGFVVRVSALELARGLSAPPAMQREETIFLRREALMRLLWERFETWRWSSPDNAMAKAFACYSFDSDVDAALAEMADAELEVVRHHEIGEFLASQILGDTWNEMLMYIAATPAELMARAVRDLLADCRSTLPFLIEENRGNSIHFYVGNLSGMRKEIFPSIQGAYEYWVGSDDRGGLLAISQQGAVHWEALALQMCDLYRSDPRNAATRIAELVKNAYL